MSCSILKFYVAEEPGTYSVDAPNLTLKIKKTPKKRKKLSDGAIRLYEKIVFRSKLHGYCWELDSTFAKEFDVSIRTVERRMSELRKFGKIRCENKVVNMKTHRKIYLISKNVCGTDKNDGPGTDKNGGHNEIPIKEERMNVCKKSSSSFSQEQKGTSASPKSNWLKHYEILSEKLEFKLCKNSFKRWYDYGFDYLNANISLVLDEYKGKEQFSQGKAMHRLIESALRDNWAGAPMA